MTLSQKSIVGAREVRQCTCPRLISVVSVHGTLQSRERHLTMQFAIVCNNGRCPVSSCYFPERRRQPGNSRRWNVHRTIRWPGRSSPAELWILKLEKVLPLLPISFYFLINEVHVLVRVLVHGTCLRTLSRPTHFHWSVARWFRRSSRTFLNFVENSQFFVPAVVARLDPCFLIETNRMQTHALSGHVESSGSRLSTKFRHRWAWLVSGWETASCREF